MIGAIASYSFGILLVGCLLFWVEFGLLFVFRLRCVFVYMVVLRSCVCLLLLVVVGVIPMDVWLFCVDVLGLLTFVWWYVGFGC